MVEIRISGVIASYQNENEENVTPTTLRKSLDNANGEAVLITINSPGGSVFQGLEMFSMIQNYSGKTETRIVSMAASMGSILALAGDKKTAESSAMYFIHNAQGVGIGDYRELEKASNWLKDVSHLLAGMYEKNTTLTFDQAKKLMDEDSQFFGASLGELGFDIVDSVEPIEPAVARVRAIARLKDCEAKISNKDLLNDLEKVAASIATKKETTNNKNIVSTPAANAGKNKEEKKSVKNLEELKAQFPEVHALAIQAGIDQQIDLVNAHLTMGEAGNCLDLAVKNIKENKLITATVQAEYMAEGMKKKDIENRISDDPENVNSEGIDSEETSEADQAAYEAGLKKKMGGKK